MYIYIWLFFPLPDLSLRSHTLTAAHVSPAIFLNTHYPLLSYQIMPLLLFSVAQNASARAQAACLMHRILARRPWRRPESGWRTAALFYRRRAAPHVCATAERLTLILAGLPERFQRVARLKDKKMK